MSPIAVVVKNRFMMSLLGSLITVGGVIFRQEGEAGEAFCRLLEQRSPTPIVPKNSHRSASSANDESLFAGSRIDPICDRKMAV